MDRFDPFSADYLADPYPQLAEARAETPVFYAADLDMWVVSRYADIEAIFTDPATFSAAIAQDPVFPLAEQARDDAARGRLPRRGDDVQLRPAEAHADPTAQPAGLLRAAHRLSNRGCGPRPKSWSRACSPSRRFDLVEELTYPLPAYMIFALIGFPPEDTELLKSWCGNRMAFSWGRPSAEEQTAIAANMARYWRYCERFVADRIAEPARRLHQRPRPGPPRRPRARCRSTRSSASIYGLSFAGHETTTNLTTNAVRRAAQAPRPLGGDLRRPDADPACRRGGPALRHERHRVAPHHEARCRSAASRCRPARS